MPRLAAVGRCERGGSDEAAGRRRPPARPQPAPRAAAKSPRKWATDRERTRRAPLRPGPGRARPGRAARSRVAPRRRGRRGAVPASAAAPRTRARPGWAATVGSAASSSAQAQSSRRSRQVAAWSTASVIPTRASPWGATSRAARRLSSSARSRRSAAASRGRTSARRSPRRHAGSGRGTAPGRPRLAEPRELVEEERAHREQQSVPPGRRVGHQQRCVDEPVEQLDRVESASASTLGQVDPAGKRRERAEQRCSPSGEQHRTTRRWSRVACSALVSRPPPVARSRARSRRSRTACSGITATWRAASSMPSGRPSSRRSTSTRSGVVGLGHARTRVGAGERARRTRVRPAVAAARRGRLSREAPAAAGAARRTPPAPGA